MNPLSRTLTAAAAAVHEQSVAMLRRYVALETPTGDAAAIDELASRVAADAETSGMRASRIPRPTGDVLVLRHPGRGDRAALPPALLVAHLDTVHPVGSLAASMPLVQDGDELRGPGTYDMKGGLVVGLGALRALAREGLAHRPVVLVCTPDEEVGSPSSRDEVVRLAADAGYALGLESPHPDGALKTSRRGSTRVRITVHGRSAHAAIAPDSGVSAIDELVDQLIALRTLVAQHPDVLCNVGAVAGGERTNVVPDTAHADVGLRFVTAQAEDEVLGQLRELAPVRPGALVDVSVISSRPAWGPGPASEALFEQVRGAAEAIGTTVAGRAAPGAADTNLTGGAGLPSVDGLGPRGAGAHALDERISLTSLRERTALVAAVLHLV
ncbi:MAG: M20 family metallopeptidase [Cellulomonadaceae bacterium]